MKDLQYRHENISSHVQYLSVLSLPGMKMTPLLWLNETVVRDLFWLLASRLTKQLTKTIFCLPAVPMETDSGLGQVNKNRSWKTNPILKKKIHPAEVGYFGPKGASLTADTTQPAPFSEQMTLTTISIKEPKREFQDVLCPD